MRIAKSMLAAGIAAIVLAGSSGIALANGAKLNTMKVRLPDGGVAVVQYSGNVPPQISFGAAPIASQVFGFDLPFAELDQISAQMNREMNALMQDTSAFALPLAAPGPLFEADLKNIPQGTVAYSMTSTISGNGTCMRSMEITRSADSKAPKVVSHSSGNCANTGSTSAWHAAPMNSGGNGGITYLPPAQVSAPADVHEVSYRPGL